MRKVLKNILAGATTAALVATLMVGINTTTTVKAADTPVAISGWTFTQGGNYNPKEPENVAYINSATMQTTNETIAGWKRGDGSKNQMQSATQASTGFTIDIANTGWDAGWDNTPVTINPWGIQGAASASMTAGHMYTVTFKMSAEPNKLAYINFGTIVKNENNEDVVLPPYDKAGLSEGSDRKIIQVGPTEKSFTYKFTNYVSGKKLDISFMLGSFNSQYDYDGTDISDVIKDKEASWKGTVTVSDLTITDNGLDPTFDTTTDPAPQTTTKAPDNNNTTTKAPGNTDNNNVTTKAPTTTAKKLAKVTKVKAKNNKPKTAKISWKKVAKAKSYQIKVGSKTYTTKKTSYTVKKLKKGKTYKVTVRAKAKGYKTGTWSKAVKVKIKK